MASAQTEKITKELNAVAFQCACCAQTSRIRFTSIENKDEAMINPFLVL